MSNFMRILQQGHASWQKRTSISMKLTPRFFMLSRNASKSAKALPAPQRPYEVHNQIPCKFVEAVAAQRGCRQMYD